VNASTANENQWSAAQQMSRTLLWRDLSKRERARELLAPVYNWFTEGFDMRDLKEAKILLSDRLGAYGQARALQHSLGFPELHIAALPT
jgi:predicted ATPase